MRFVDLTRPLAADTPVWPGDPAIRLSVATDHPLVHHLALGTHSGTHLDAPRHLFPVGASVTDVALGDLIGPAWTVDLGFLPPGHRITAADLAGAGIPANATRVLIRTRNSAITTHFDPAFVALDPDAAAWLLAQGVRLVGIDGPSVDPFDSPDLPVHRLLLGAGIPLLEYLQLTDAPPGEGWLMALPLCLSGGDGAPVRAVLQLD